MTVLLGGLGLVLTLAVAGFLSEIHESVVARARAQTAADAAALAAASESAPYGVGSPGALAREYAEANGAELLDCDCVAGAPAAQVKVSFDGVVAEARAGYDADRLQPLFGADTDGLHPDMARAVDALVRAADGAVRVISGYRSTERQAQLWSQALARYGSIEAADDWVAPPGHSMHERGLAVDLDGDLELAARLVARLGLSLHRPLPNEPWHFELIGSRQPV